jgi:hypothetical protein
LAQWLSRRSRNGFGEHQDAHGDQYLGNTKDDHGENNAGGDL